jgi:phosphoglycerate dehydrogenase-like enzyme
LIIGFGEIGRAIGDVLTAFQVDLVLCSRKIPPNRSSIGKWVDVTELKNHLAEIDMIFLSAPLNDSTRNLLNADLLRKLPSHSVVINVGRAGLVDIAEAYQLLREGRLGGLAFDVPHDDSLGFPNGQATDVPNLIISPFMAARYNGRGEDLERFVERQATNWVNKQQLENLVVF